MTDSLDRLKSALAGQYDIENELGAGGMATVYLAHDAKHDRKVAVKVLRPELAAVLGTERFLNEIKITANLSHPHILPLLDSGTAEELPSARPPDRPSAFLYYVMPYLEGESLRERLDREKQLSIEDAIETAKAVASALDYAHRHNVIHRDIKPENILLHDGQPVVADFGISLAVSAAGGTRLTETGLSLGTPQYMSPEQATGDREIDGRSDIYSLACVLYEMLSGEPPHTGPTVQAVIAKVVTDHPRPVTELRDTVPSHIAAVVHKALAKLPADRFASASHFVDEFGKPGALDVSALSTRQMNATQAQASLTLRRFAIAGWAAAAGFLILTVLFALVWSGPSGQDASVRHLNINLPDSAPLAFAGPAPLGIWQRALAVSRDGRTLAYVAPFGASTRLYVRHLEQPAFEALEGTEGAYHPFFSPDGRWVGYFTGHELKKVQVTGGQPVPLAQDLVEPVGAFWADEGRILVANHEGLQPTWVPAAGGPSELLDTLIAQFNSPALVFRNKWAVGTILYSGALALMSLEDGTLHAITRGGLRTDSLGPQDRLVGYNPTYSPTGHLLYLSTGDGVLMALPFDAERGDVLGEPAPVMSSVRKEETYGFGHFAICDDGTLYFAPGGNADIGYLALVAPDGRVDTLGFPRALYEAVHLSHEGQRAAVSIRSELGLRTAHILDLQSETQTPVRAAGVPNAWSRSGEEIVLAQRDHTRLDPFAGVTKVLHSLTDGSTRRLDLVNPGWVDLARNTDLVAWSARPDRDIFIAPLHATGNADSMPEKGGQVSLSPSGEWLAYHRVADERVRVSPYPPTGQIHQISDGRGEQPRWSPNGDRLVYRRGRRFFQVSASALRGSDPVSPRLLAEGPFVRVWNWSYDVAPDGRLLVVLGSPERTASYINVVTNFHSVLDSLAPRR